MKKIATKLHKEAQSKRIFFNNLCVPLCNFVAKIKEGRNVYKLF
jgi:hypothetical protein